MPHTERTLTILKPDAVAAGRSGAILAHLEQAGFRILGMRRLHLTRAQAEAFYAVHRERGFYQDLVRFMTEGPVLACALERENAVAELRRVMGATDPAKAEAGTVRKLYATSIERNAIHGSDAAATARHEIGFFFAQADLL
ncbi:MAG TPA: nucleoside-diphosphate kinase [Terriglobales bacterium]|nr:nucleoside-diphosphate kinase [Terriglobales bacterium]